MANKNNIFKRNGDNLYGWTGYFSAVVVFQAVDWYFLSNFDKLWKNKVPVSPFVRQKSSSMSPSDLLSRQLIQSWITWVPPSFWLSVVVSHCGICAGSLPRCGQWAGSSPDHTNTALAPCVCLCVCVSVCVLSEHIYFTPIHVVLREFCISSAKSILFFFVWLRVC